MQTTRSLLSSPRIRDRLLELIAAGMTFPQAAGVFGMSSKAIQREMKRDPEWGAKVREAQAQGVEARRLGLLPNSEALLAEKEQVGGDDGTPERRPVRTGKPAPPIGKKWWSGAGECPTPEAILGFVARTAATDGHPLQQEAFRQLGRLGAVGLRGEGGPAPASVREAREKAEQEAAEAAERPHVPRGLTVLALPAPDESELDDGESEPGEAASGAPAEAAVAEAG